MQRFLALIFFLLLLAPTLVKTGYSLNYMINFSYYKEVLCANKNNPNMDCNGKCVLKKQLKSASKEKEESEKALTSVEEIQLPAFVCPDELWLEVPFIAEVKLPFISFQEDEVLNPRFEIEHPPC